MGKEQVRSWRLRRLLRLFGALAAATVVVSVLLAWGYAYWYYHRPLPTPLHEELFRGVTYTREVRSSPRPLVVHVIEVRLDAPGIGFLVTPDEPTAGYQLRARTTSQFLKEFKLQVAVNAGFFYPLACQRSTRLLSARW
jgi:hypothetical protein